LIARADISQAALSLLGTPFHAQGRAPGIGLDCIGVVVCVARACGIPVADRTAYPMRPNGELRGELESRLVRVTGSPREGDVLLMALDREPHHVALVIDGNRIVHAHMRARKTVVQTYTEYWRSVTVAAYRFPGVE
jgi:cell wall-associated NlpC family hydrolase